MFPFAIAISLLGSVTCFWLGGRIKQAQIRHTMTRIVLQYGREADAAINKIQELWEEHKEEGSTLRQEFQNRILQSDTAIEIFRKVFDEKQDNQPIR